MNILDYTKYPAKNYQHVDTPINIIKVENYVTDRQKISRHSFLPFIKNDHIGKKWTQKESHDEKHFKIKERKIMYAGHLDNYIYRYYTDCLNETYNNYLKDEGLDQLVIAYRTNKPGQSNINFAAEVINSIVESQESYILLGDFSDFFDNINHSLLKENLKIVLKTDRLCKDWFNVYRSATKYGYYNKYYLDEGNAIQKYHDQWPRQFPENQSYFDSIKSFRRFQRKHGPKSNRESYGIPQGLALSGVFSNITCLDFDKKMHELCGRYEGTYRRYSDDFILILPKDKINQSGVEELRERIINLAQSNHLTLNKEKTHISEYKDRQIYDFVSGKRSRIDYLGFIFDGRKVRMRGKSVYKFYRKAYRLIDKAKAVKRRKNLTTIPYKRKLYRLYTDYGTQGNGYGNFISYAKRAQSIFDKVSPLTENRIEDQLKNRKKKLIKRLNQKR